MDKAEPLKAGGNEMDIVKMCIISLGTALTATGAGWLPVGNGAKTDEQNIFFGERRKYE